MMRAIEFLCNLSVMIKTPQHLFILHSIMKQLCIIHYTYNIIFIYTQL